MNTYFISYQLTVLLIDEQHVHQLVGFFQDENVNVNKVNKNILNR